MSAPYRVQTLDILKARLAAMRGAGLTWRKIATEFDGVPAGTLCAISKGREPRGADIRAALGLPVLLPAPACVCGQVHIRTGRCPNAPKPAVPKRVRPTLAEVKRLRWAVAVLGWAVGR